VKSAVNCMVGFENSFDIRFVNANNSRHQLVLRSLHNSPMDFEKVRWLQGLEAKAFIVKAPITDHFTIQLWCILCKKTV
jgi:hypothetical protein